MENTEFGGHSHGLMVKQSDDEEVGERITRLWKALGYETSADFAVNCLKVSTQRLNNIENGKPLGRDMAFKIVQAVPGLTTDWLWFGSTEGLTVAIARKLGALGAKAGKSSN